MKCNNILYSTSISAALGFIIVGNCYDNLSQPRTLLLAFLILASFLCVVEGLFVQTEHELPGIQQLKEKSVFTLFQVSNVVEAGISVACIVNVHNWFERSKIGTVSAMILSSIFLMNLT